MILAVLDPAPSHAAPLPLQQDSTPADTSGSRPPEGEKRRSHFTVEVRPFGVAMHTIEGWGTSSVLVGVSIRGTSYVRAGAQSWLTLPSMSWRGPFLMLGGSIEAGGLIGEREERRIGGSVGIGLHGAVEEDGGGFAALYFGGGPTLRLGDHGRLSLHLEVGHDVYNSSPDRPSPYAAFGPGLGFQI